MRSALFALLLAATSTSVIAKDSAKATRQFIDKAYISLPKSVGVYTLERMDYEPEQWQAGVSGAYQLRGGPKQLTITLFVYPQGRGDEAKITEQQIEIVEQGIRAHPDYSEIQAGPRQPFAVPTPKTAAEADAGAQPDVEEEGDSAAKDSELDPKLMQALAMSAAPDETLGRRQVYNSKLRGEPVRSVAFTFYRQLHNMKLRITVPADAMGQAEFETLADGAARALVPAVDISNVGTCADVQIVLPAKGSKGGDDMMAQILLGSSRVERENCSSKPVPEIEKVPDNVERRVIEYPAGTWN